MGKLHNGFCGHTQANPCKHTRIHDLCCQHYLVSISTLISKTANCNLTLLQRYRFRRKRKPCQYENGRQTFS